MIDKSSDVRVAEADALRAAGHPELIEAANHLLVGAFGKAEPLCRIVLKRDPLDVNAMRLLAEIGMEVGRLEDAEALLVRALELAPDFRLARGSYANVLGRRGKFEAALTELDTLLAQDSRHPGYLILKANTLVRIGNHEDAIAIYRDVLARNAATAGVQMSLGHSLKTVGQQDEAIAAYNAARAMRDDLGDAYWSLANLKTFRFSDDDIDTMRRAAARETIDREDYYHLAFALGKALEDRGEYGESFTWYRRGNAIKRRLVAYNADENQADMAKLSDYFTADIFASRQNAGCQSRAPIFIIGLPRAGSTLLEQILASHSQVEGTQELPDIISLARRIADKKRAGDPSNYPLGIRDLTDSELTALGEEYIERTRIHRTDAPFFIDKMPNNFAHVGLIKLILPKATIIDARRHPLACCFSGYKQLFAKGQHFTYNLTDIGRYYADYVGLMRHWQNVLPSHVLHVQYEDVVADTETQVRRLLAHCGLPFEEACLRFYENRRAVKTASSEQVRQPIFTSGLDQWENYEPWLGPLETALGEALQTYKQ
ncbi:MAG: sulfotransferase [Alphaproteobacteria bacterium]|nr:sulfotransferase [Alphaproteobacteria bacterium]MBU2142028.1 sulfotransferase [Alphaproteobacteria bacterium]MBU2196920.1 sulfotransferase [Alphaproteobacteria bacterium]